MKPRLETRSALATFVQEMSKPATDEIAEVWPGGFRNGRLPNDPGQWLTLTGDTYSAYQTALDGLESEPSLAMHGRSALDGVLWEFGLSIDRASAGAMSDDEAKRLADRFLRTLDARSIEWNVLLETEGIADLDGAITALDVTFEPMSRRMLDEWLSSANSSVFAGEINALLGKPVAVVKVRAGDSQKAVEIAHRKVDASLDALRFALSGVRPTTIPSQQMLFRRGRHTWCTPVDGPSQFSSSAEVGFRQVPLSITGRTRMDTSALLARLDGSGRARNVSDSLLRAAQWIGTSMRIEEPDLKIVTLCTAAESFLTAKSDLRKGEHLVLRAMLLCASSNTQLPNPMMLFDLYEKRSQVVHGSKINVCGENEYQWLRQLVVVLLQFAQSYEDRYSSQTLSDFFANLETRENSDAVVADLAARSADNRIAANLLKFAQERLAAVE